MADVQISAPGDLGFGMGSDALARVGDQNVTEREMSEAMQRRLQEARQQNPDATMPTIAGDFDPLLNAMIDQATLLAFADKYGFHLSKRLVDAEIAQIPGTKGLNGKFSDDAYQAFLAQRGMTDAQVRRLIAGGLLQRLMLTPVAINARVPVGMALPYASMLLESREGEAAVVPDRAVRRRSQAERCPASAIIIPPTARATSIPEQRTCASPRSPPARSRASPQARRKSPLITTPIRRPMAAQRHARLTQVVVPDQKTADRHRRARARPGRRLAAAAAPAGGNAALTDTSVTQIARALRSRRRRQGRGCRVRGAAGRNRRPAPVRFRLGRGEGRFGQGRAAARRSPRRAAKSPPSSTADKRKHALEDLVDKVQTAIDEGSNLRRGRGSRQARPSRRRR